jgi:phosphopantetheinyl transferase (holo-ACP synthase)
MGVKRTYRLRNIKIDRAIAILSAPEKDIAENYFSEYERTGNPPCEPEKLPLIVQIINLFVAEEIERNYIKWEQKVQKNLLENEIKEKFKRLKERMLNCFLAGGFFYKEAELAVNAIIKNYSETCTESPIEIVMRVIKKAEFIGKNEPQENRQNLIKDSVFKVYDEIYEGCGTPCNKNY